MLSRSLMIFIATALTMFGGFTPRVHADGGEEMSTGHFVERYGGTVQEFDTDDSVVLSKSSVDEVKVFFETKHQNCDRVEAVFSQGLSAYHLIHVQIIQGVEQSLELVKLEERTSEENMHPALGELKGQVMMGKHSEAEFQALTEKYKHLKSAYFRQVADGQGGTISEGAQIYRTTYNQVHGNTKAEMREQAPASSQKAQSAELRQQMQAMKAKGDIAGMMQMAKGFKVLRRLMWN